MVKKMVLGVQILGLVFGIVMIYLAFVYMRKKEISLNDFLFWLIIWILFIVAAMIPQTINIFMETLGIVSAMQFFTVFGFVFLFAFVFYIYKNVKKTQRMVAKIVKEIALQNIKNQRFLEPLRNSKEFQRGIKKK